MVANRLAVLGVSAAAVVGILMVPGTASAGQVTPTVQAAQSHVVSVTPASYTPDVNNGLVDALGQSGSTVFVGGSFTSVSPHGSSVTQARAHLFGFTAGTGAIVSGFNPTVSGNVNSIIPGPTAGTVLIGGAFSKVDGVNTHVALLNTSTGAIVAGWKAPAINGEVNDIVLSNGRLYVGGYFTTVGGQSRVGLAVLSPTTGALLSYAVPSFTGHHNWGRNCDPTTQTCSKAGTGIKAMDINPAGTRLAAVGNFVNVSGATTIRDQVAVLNLSSTAATVDTGWATAAYTAKCIASAYDVDVRDVQFSPDGSYFVIAATGGGALQKNTDGTQTSCDTAARYETNGSGSDVRPTWIDYTGNDTFLSLAVSGTAIYVGGHERWVNNSQGSDAPKEGSVPRPGMVALDPVNGMPLAWNPGRNPRGAGAYAMLATSDGLYVGSDTDWIGNFKFQHKKLAFFPLAGGKTLANNTTDQLPGSVYLLGSPTSASMTSVPYSGTGTPGAAASVAGVDWSNVRGAFEVNDQVYYGTTVANFYRRSFSGSGFGPAVAIDPYDDPVWDNVQTGSGQTYQGLKSAFYGEMPSITSMFYYRGRVYYTLANKSGLFWRWFETDDGVMGADEFTISTGPNFSHVAGAFLSGNTLYYADSVTHHLFRVAFTRGQPSGPATLADASIDWTSRGAFVWRNGTTTSLAVDPSGHVKQQHPLTLTATVSLASKAGSHPAGRMTFLDGTTTLGHATVNTSTGRAVLTTDTVPPSAPHETTLTASFNPADSTLAGSISPTVAYTVNPKAKVPTMTGRIRVGARDTCVEAAPPDAATNFAWQVDGKQVATGETYTVAESAYRKELTCTAAVSLGSGPQDTATSKQHEIARGRSLKAEQLPALSGQHRVGTKEITTDGSWTPAATSYSYQWYVGTTKIRHATRRSLRLTSAERGKRVSCRVRAHRTGYTSHAETTERVKVTR
jgi:hypothetical protein